MGVLTDQLFKAGLVSKTNLQEQQFKEKQEADARFARQQIWMDDMEKLNECTTMQKFKSIAAKILFKESSRGVKDFSKIRVIVEMAHRFKDEEGGMPFVIFFLQLKSALKKLPVEAHRQFLEKTF